MGMPVTATVRDPGVDPQALDPAFAELRAVDARFSTYRADSEISRKPSTALFALVLNMSPLESPSSTPSAAHRRASSTCPRWAAASAWGRGTSVR